MTAAAFGRTATSLNMYYGKPAALLLILSIEGACIVSGKALKSHPSVSIKILGGGQHEAIQTMMDQTKSSLKVCPEDARYRALTAY